MKTKYIFFGIGAIIIIALIAVYSNQKTASQKSAKSLPALTYTDATKTTVTLTKRPTRFVCITALCEDILFELGIKPVAISDSLSSEPEFWGQEAKKWPQVGGTFFQPSLEDLAKAKPDIIIGLAGVHDKIRSAVKPIAPLYIMDLSKYQDSLKYLADIGRLTGRTKQAEDAKNKFLHKLAAYKTKSPNNKSAALMSGSDVNFSIDTNAALYGGLLAQVTQWPWTAPANLQTGAEQNNTIPYSLEKVLQVDPDVIFVISDGTTPESKLLSTNPLWSKLKAVQNNQVYEVRPDVWEYGRGTRSLSITLDEAMKKIYPNSFQQPLQ